MKINEKSMRLLWMIPLVIGILLLVTQMFVNLFVEEPWVKELILTRSKYSADFGLPLSIAVPPLVSKLGTPIAALYSFLMVIFFIVVKKYEKPKKERSADEFSVNRKTWFSIIFGFISGLILGIAAGFAMVFIISIGFVLVIGLIFLVVEPVISRSIEGNMSYDSRQVIIVGLGYLFGIGIGIATVFPLGAGLGIWTGAILAIFVAGWIINYIFIKQSWRVKPMHA